MSAATEIAREAVRSGASQKVGELAELVLLVQQLEPQVILEIGSMNGGTLRAWKAAAPHATLISVSLTNGIHGGGAVEPGITDNHLDLDSHSPATFQRVQELLGVRPVDFLFIDGDHSYAGVSQDFWMYAPLVRDGGIVALHDILYHAGQADVEVEEFWQQIRPHFETSEFCEPEQLRDGHPWGGIGVVHL